MPDVVYGELEQADVILHAGDVVTSELLDELAGFAPVHAVLGNNDHDLVGRLRVTDQVLVDGLAIGLIHDSGQRVGRDGRMSRRFPDAKVVVYGHSHIPDDHVGVGGQVLFNPGSPTDRRAQPHHTYGILEVADGALTAHRIVAIAG
ncbi:MAG: YfcE family phosphodiesterase [Acidimicrobiales bacterium]